MLGPLEVPELGFGCWGIGGLAEDAPPAYGPTSDVVSMQALRRALELGLNYFDTSPLYGAGHSESLLGRAFGSSRERVILASKAGYLRSFGPMDFSVKYQRRSFEGSLRRLQTDYLDLFQLHDPRPDEVTAELWSELAGWKAAGKVRALGVSARSPAEGLEILKAWHFDVVQANYSLVDQRAREVGLLDYCRTQGRGFVARTPLCFGFLAGPQELAEQGDQRQRWSPAQQQRWRAAQQTFRQALADLAFPGTDAQLALRFCLDTPGVSLAIPGMLTPEQVEDNAGACALTPLTEEQRGRLEQVYAETSFFEVVVAPRST